MYIRWVIRNHKSTLSAPMVFHDAYLVESYRAADGRPRQRTICYLGNVRQIDEAIPHVESELFLLRAAGIVHHVARTIPLDSTRILDALHQHLPVLTPETARHAFAAQVRWFYAWWARHGTSRPDQEITRVVTALLSGSHPAPE